MLSCLMTAFQTKSCVVVASDAAAAAAVAAAGKVLFLHCLCL